MRLLATEKQHPYCDCLGAHVEGLGFSLVAESHPCPRASKNLGAFITQQERSESSRQSEEFGNTSFPSRAPDEDTASECFQRTRQEQGAQCIGWLGLR